MEKEDKKILLGILASGVIAPVVSIMTLQIIKKISEIKKR